ncbi:TlyA family RNA methyltransferase [bacterium]|jgi:23S rRNA (cytidine1920-2'-O)/16S rRNA (cytidine1409-2'-O)-methyltransferase|nr:TlyA family RNA methyltransferase [bacterium]
MKKHRLDDHLVKHGIVDDIKAAQAYIMGGKVLVNDQKITQAGTPIKPDVTIRLLGKKTSYASRGGDKLAGALKTFGVSVQDRTTMDVGQSTGGFTDCLLKSGASHVIGLDVGYGIVDYRIRTDSRVTVIERYNARLMDRANLEAAMKDAAPILGQVSVVVMDVSFISILKILPAIRSVIPEDCEVVTLVKPQFEASKSEIGEGGIVRDDAIRETIVTRLREAIPTTGFEVLDQCASPITGTKGNQESFFWLKAAAIAN